VNKLARLTAATLLLGVIVGCKSGEDTTTVSGTVTVLGETMGKGALSFYPAGGARPIGVPVTSEGSYSAVLPPGDYSVVAMTSNDPPPGWKEGDPLPPPKVRIPQKYTQPRSTPLNLSVADEDITQDFDIR
jgi:hypothetical protein